MLPGRLSILSLRLAKKIAMLLAKAIGADRAEKQRELRIRLAVLFGQVADRRVEGPAMRARHRRRASCPLRPGFPFQRLRTRPGGRPCRKLEEVADENGLQPAEGIVGFADELTNLADGGKVCPDNMKISSMMRTRVFLILSVTRRLFAITSMSERVTV